MKLLVSLLLFAAAGFTTVLGQSSSTPEKQVKQSDWFISENNSKRAKNPQGVTFTVGIKDNRKQFHQGEVITLEFSFAASKPDTFNLDSASYDRSGRLFTEDFFLDQHDGVVDPLYDYFNSPYSLLMIGGLRGRPDLTDKPYVITAELNEWKRLDKPGRYRLYVVSSRVGRKESSKSFLDNAGSRVASNVVEFEVLPADKKWERKKLNEAITLLSKPGLDDSSACRTLRFLGTTAAVSEIVKRFYGEDNKCEWEYKFGLIGSPHRESVIREMRNSISSPEQPITSTFISTLALCEFAKQGPAPSYPAGNDKQIAEWEAQIESSRKAFDQLRLNYVRELVLAIPQKQGHARATSLETLLDHRWELDITEFSQWSTLFASMPEVFSRLPFDRQSRLLQYHWKLIASDTMLPILRRILKLGDGPPLTTMQDTMNHYHREEFRSIALRRLYELSPEEGRSLILDQIRSPKPRVNEAVLLSLPDKSLPELDDVLATNLQEAHTTQNVQTRLVSLLIERYATSEILSRVRPVYEGEVRRRGECASRAALLAYFLRVEPSIGREYLNEALAARDGYPRCFESTLKNVAQLHMSADVEVVATAALDDADSDVVSNAAEVLKNYGSADAEKALWQRLEKWHAALPSESQDLDKLDTGGKVLRNALSGGQAWLSNPAKLERLLDFCLTEKGCEEIDKAIRTWSYGVYVGFNLADEPSSISVAHYVFPSIDALKQKLLQFPKGTLFTWRTHGSTRGEDSAAQRLFQQLKTHLEENGMKLEQVSEPNRP